MKTANKNHCHLPKILYSFSIVFNATVLLVVIIKLQYRAAQNKGCAQMLTVP